MFEITYEVVKGKKKSIYKRVFLDKDMAESEMTFAKGVKTKMGIATAVSMKKVKKS